MRKKPVFGRRPFGKRDARLLIVAYFDPNGIETIPQGIEAWQALSRHEIVLMNLWPGREGRVRLPSGLDLRRFDGVIVHPTVSYAPSTVQALDAGIDPPLSEYDGVKILMKQDEQVNAGLLGPLVRDKGFDIVFTCVPPAEQEKVYPRAVIGPDCTLIQTFTGYVSPDMRQRFSRGARDLGLTYRGSIQPLAFGRLGYEKRGVGYDMEAALQPYADVRSDISSRWEDRLSGTEWSNFLARSGVVLGVESGSNIFDFDGSVAEWCRGYDERHRGEDATTYAYYKRAHDEFLHTVEDNVNYAQISPRHFEAAASGAAQLLYEGEYSGLFLPDRHFFPLRKDLSNIDAVMDFLRDDTVQRRMAEAAFEEIILGPANWYEAFVAEADRAVDAKLAAKGRRPAAPARQAQARPLAYIVCAHDPSLDPRIGWMAETLARTCRVVVIGTYPFDTVGDRPRLEERPDGIALLRVERTRHAAEWLPAAGELASGPLSQARGLLASLVGYAAAATPLLRESLGADIAAEAEVARFRELCAYMVNTNAALFGAVQKLGPPNLVVAADLEALYAAVACGETSGARVVFDAHKYWPWSYTDFQHWEIDFWSAMEGRLVSMTDLNISVTPQLAARMGHEYGVSFRSLPNAATHREGDLAAVEAAFAERTANRGPLRILYQGGFAQGRGLEESIRAMDIVQAEVQLILRGPDNEYRQGLVALAHTLGLGEDRVRFAPAVQESELISAALEADVGLIPYNPAWFGYRYCCPNKLSQYAAAGLPILSSTTEFVAGMVRSHDIGFVADVADPARLAAVFDELFAKRDDLVAIGRRARRFFETHFNWDVLVAPVAAEIGSLLEGEVPRSADFGWLDGVRGGADPERGRTVFPPASVFGGGLESGHADLASFEAGASLAGSSPFNPYPNDAALLLREPRPGGYAAALDGTALPHWVAIDLGQPKDVGSVQIEWFDAANRPSRYRLLARTSATSTWVEILSVTEAGDYAATHRLPNLSFRFLRLEAFGFVGQQRMLIRLLRVVASGDPAHARIVDGGFSVRAFLSQTDRLSVASVTNFARRAARRVRRGLRRQKGT